MRVLVSGASPIGFLYIRLAEGADPPEMPRDGGLANGLSKRTVFFTDNPTYGLQVFDFKTRHGHCVPSRIGGIQHGEVICNEKLFSWPSGSVCRA